MDKKKKLIMRLMRFLVIILPKLGACKNFNISKTPNRHDKLLFGRMSYSFYESPTKTLKNI